MEPLAITIAGTRFDHLLYHFMLPYSNWETGTICFSESFESLSEGLQIDSCVESAQCARIEGLLCHF